MVNLKKYVYYSKKNPYMKYYKNDSYCVSCEGHYIGKRGAQSHSSKIHNMTLDGRELDQETEITPKLVSKETPPVENIPDEDEDYHRTMKDADLRINLNLKIRQLEKSGLQEQAYEIRKKHNLFETKPDKTPEKSTDNETKNMLIMMLANEQDPVLREKITQMYMMKLCGASDDAITSMISMHMLNTIPEKPAEKSETQKQLELQIVRNGIENMNREPLDDLLRIQKSIGKTNNDSLVDDFALRLKKLKEPKMTHNDVLPNPATGPVLPSAKRTIPFLITDNRKIPPVKQVFPMGRLFFLKTRMACILNLMNLHTMMT
jgi:hypothetical protein